LNKEERSAAGVPEYFDRGVDRQRDAELFCGSGEWAKEPQRLMSLVCRRRRPALLIIPPRSTRTAFRVFRNYRLHPQLVVFERRFRLLELPLPEIRSEFDRHTSNAGMPQSEMPRLARCQEFHRLSRRRHRVLSRQSGGLKQRNPAPSRPSLLWLIFSPVAFVFSS
jgi:hypothetical protein